jgi:hypothetical protein
VDYSKFQIAVIELASDGVPVTTANVVARLRVEPKKAEALLDRMARENLLDVDIDDDIIVYRVRGLTVDPTKKRLDALRGAVESGGTSTAMAKIGTAMVFGKRFAKGGSPLPVSLQRSVARGALLGGVLPGLGLAYAAPWTVTVLATLTVVVGFKVLGAISIMLAMPFLVLACVVSAVYGALYTWRYNQVGKRAALSEDEPKKALSPKIRL